MPAINTKPVFTAIPARTRRDHVVEHLRDAILAGEIAPGAKLIEADLSRQLGVSRAPLREAIRELVEQKLLQSVPYTGTFVAEITARELDEIYSMRAVLESFAFRLLWDRRDASFREELNRRHQALLGAIDAGDGGAAIKTEMHLHSYAYEFAGHRILLDTWQALRGRLQFYFAIHQQAHHRHGPRRNAHDLYVEMARGDDLNVMLEHIQTHMRQGLDAVIDYLAETDSNTGEDGNRSGR